MGLNLGNTNIGEIYLGNTKITEAYLGSSKIYSSAAPGPTDEVQIGTQIWKTSNLAIDDGHGGIKVVNDVTVNGVNLGTQYYYTAEAALRVANTITGWHIPSLSEYSTLINFIRNTYSLTTQEICTKLRSNYAWSSNGTDDYGFCALPLGGYNDSDVALAIGSAYRCWTSTNYGSGYYYLGQIYVSSYSVVDYYKKVFKFGVRLIKDST